LIVLDNESTDGTRREALKYTDRVINIPKGSYIPGRVLNKGMELSKGEIVVFINSDCTPQNTLWLERLVSGFSDEKVAAVFGRQIPRPDCLPLFAKDTEDTYGDGHNQQYWRHCFSMAASAIRRSVWEQMRFNERIKYSEDIDWTWRARNLGHSIQYVAGAIVMHSHNYTLRQFYNRHYGEGRAESEIFDWTLWQRSFVRYSLMPYSRQVLNDWKYCLNNFDIKSALYSPVLRMAQLVGRRAGLIDGLKDTFKSIENNKDKKGSLSHA
jgi:rhamnosyltransferase